MPHAGRWAGDHVTDLDPDIASLAARLGVKGLRYTSFARPLPRVAAAAPAPPAVAAPAPPGVQPPREAAPPPPFQPAMLTPVRAAPVAAAPFPLISEALAAARGASDPALPAAARPFAGLAAAVAARRAAGG